MREFDENYYIEAGMRHDIKTGALTQPSVTHNKPEDYCLTRKDSILARLRCLRSERSKWQKELEVCYHDLFNHYNWVDERYALEFQRKVDKLDRDIKFNMERLKQKEDRSNGIDINEVKKVPIPSISDILPSGFFVNNPFRNEKSPSNSLHYDKRTNRWKDFGTDKHGDVIDLYMAIHNCTFIDALKELNTLCG